MYIYMGTCAFLKHESLGWFESLSLLPPQYNILGFTLSEIDSKSIFESENQLTPT